ncbi:MAG: hypothetical protein K2P35_09785 [Lachnospiraceae bacterium]|nr:hypothetical protein [Lachnospiraceae bacterium]
MLLFGRYKGHVKKIIRRIIVIALGFFLLMMSTIGYLYFNAEYIQDKIKEKVCACVLIHEDDLLKTVEECKNNKATNFTSYITQGDSSGSVYYKELSNTTINKVFKIFRLWYIRTDEEDDIVKFSINPTILYLLWGRYEYGFYYTKEDQAVDVFWAEWDECNEETKGIILGAGEYWYRTEQIDDNWWFYESKLELYPVKR